LMCICTESIKGETGTRWTIAEGTWPWTVGVCKDCCSNRRGQCFRDHLAWWCNIDYCL